MSNRVKNGILVVLFTYSLLVSVAYERNGIRIEHARGTVQMPGSKKPLSEMTNEELLRMALGDATQPYQMAPNASLDLQASCSNQAHRAFTEYRSLPYVSSDATFNDHYSRKYNRCFIEITEFTTFEGGTLRLQSRYIGDAYENRQFAYYAARLNRHGTPFQCEFFSLDSTVRKTCNSLEEFNRIATDEYMGT